MNPIPVSIRDEVRVFPTYLPAAPDPNPMFLEKRVYQGSSGRVYPLPFIDRIAEKPVPHEWRAVLEMRARAGIVHIANPHISPGKKQWTWGNQEFGYARDRLLTDADAHGVHRPYIELMVGVYTENQPDFSYLQPGETKSWVQLWYPFREIGPADQANADVAVSLRVAGRAARLLFESDQPAKRLGETHESRLRALLRHPRLVARRDDLCVELCALHN